MAGTIAGDRSNCGSPSRKKAITRCKLQTSRMRHGTLWTTCPMMRPGMTFMYKIYVRQAIEAGLADSEAGRTKDAGDVRGLWKPSTYWTNIQEGGS